MDSFRTDSWLFVISAGISFGRRIDFRHTCFLKITLGDYKNSLNFYSQQELAIQLVGYLVISAGISFC